MNNDKKMLLMAAGVMALTAIFLLVKGAEPMIIILTDEGAE